MNEIQISMNEDLEEWMKYQYELMRISMNENLEEWMR